MKRSKSSLKISLLIAAIFTLSACGTNQPANQNFDPHAMPGMPCHQMGGKWMGDCEFDEAGNPILSTSEPAGASAGLFSRSVEGLPEAQPSQIVELKDGDSYEMTAELVKQEIGNQTIKRLAYNGQIPGPLLKVPQGAQITLKLTNKTDVDTTLHSHGLRLENAFDGVPEVTQKPIKPGESFSYQLKFPDAGIYWYHPHIREDYAQELGLYGNYLVQSSDPDYWNLVDREEPLILDDLLVDEAQPAFPTQVSDHALMGRFGNVLLINNEEDFKMQAKKGEVIRFFFTNTANVRPFNLQLLNPSGQVVRFKVVGGDSGRAEKEAFADSVLLAPSERAVVEVLFEQEGNYQIQHVTPQKTYVMGRIAISGQEKSASDDSFLQLRQNPDDYSSVRSSMKDWLAKAPDKSLRLSIDMMGMGMEGMEMGMTGEAHGDGMDWEDDMAQMNQASSSKTVTWKLIDEETGKENMDIDWSFKKGDMVKIRVFNDPESMHPMQHPIHFHGQRFVVLSRNEVANDNLQWKDTTLVKTGETVDLLVEMSNPGEWMAHCHIAEHLHSGMMLGFKVE